MDKRQHESVLHCFWPSLYRRMAYLPVTYEAVGALNNMRPETGAVHLVHSRFRAVARRRADEPTARSSFLSMPSPPARQRENMFPHDWTPVSD